MRFAMTSRASHSLLVAALAFLVLPSYGTAQAPRRPAQPDTPYRAATRALNEGRYDEVEAMTEKLDQRDPNIAAVKGRALIARGHYAQAEALLRPVAVRVPSSEAALELGLLQQMLGRTDATALLEKVAPLADSSNDPVEVARAGRALRALGRFHESNAAYRDAAGAAPNDAAIQTAFGDLFLEKYDKPEALKSYQMALAVDSKYTPALVGAARVLADENPPQATTLAAQALAINPSSVDAQIFLAGEAADSNKHDEARKALDAALAVNPASLEAIALRAALSYLEDKPQEFEAEAAKALAIAPRYGEVYRIAGDLAARNYRFDEAVELTRRALALDANNFHAQADLGSHLLRTGDEAGARVALEAAWKADPFSKLTKNLLDVMDKVDKYVTIRDGDVVMRLDPTEAPVLREYAMALAHQALSTLAARYEFTPRGPILIEIFPKQDDFAVRTLGLPGMVGALGVCFGRVVVMDSPNAGPRGEFQWEATMWHELAHVITLQMSNQRVPRWLTEGISVYEEKKARAEWGREMDVTYAGMLNRGETLTLKKLNSAFTNPKTISLAYYEASLLVEHIVNAYGDAGLHKLVRAYAQGIDTDAALKAALNTDLDQMQAGFDQTIEKMFGAMRRAMAMPEGVEELMKMPAPAIKSIADANPRSFPVQMALGTALRKAGQVDEAMQAFERAAALVPAAGGPGSPHEQLAALALQKNDRPRAIAELTALVAVDFNNVDAARQLADLLRKSGTEDPAKLAPVYQRIAAIDPFDPEAHAMLGRFALARNESDNAAREFRTVLALGPVDKAAAYTDLGESYFKGGKRAEAKKQVILALEIAPGYERAQELLLKLVEK
jgi:tetratricopeptide (TPR) repeat protein